MALLVDRAARTVTGLVLPWMVVGVVGYRYRFARGSLCPDARPVLLIDHDQGLRAGRTVDAWADEAGLWATHRIARGRIGDAALDLAEHPDCGSSPHADFVAVGPDPAMPDVILVSAAVWTETSLTRTPTYTITRGT